MTALAAPTPPLVHRDVLADYDRFVETLDIDRSNIYARRQRARLFLERHGGVAVWMRRPTPARLTDLHRGKAWPFLTWLLIEGHVQADLELVLAKPPGVDIGVWWRRAHPEDVAAAEDVAGQLGWSTNWTHQIVAHALPVVCLARDKTLQELGETDFDALDRELNQAASVPGSTRTRFFARAWSLREICFQLGTIDAPPRDSKPPARSPAEHAGQIPQPEIRSEVVRYAQTISTVLRPATAQMRIKAIRVLCEWLAAHHPDVTRLEQIDRHRHIEPFLAWARTRPFRGTNAGGRTVSIVAFHHDVLDLHTFFEDISEWGWASAPPRRLLFISDLPRLPEAVPRALPPDVDRAVMAAVADLDDSFARCGLTMLRLTGMRVGELLDLELDCLVDFARHGTWLRVPLGKLGTERMVPLDPAALAALDTWIARRGRQRPLPHPRDGHPAEFVFVRRGRRLGAHRLRLGLAAAVEHAGVHDKTGKPMHVTLHQLRHTFGTTLVNAGMSLPALMALLGHVTPEMTLRYAKLASPTIRAAYDTAMTKVNGRRPLFTIPPGHHQAVPSKIDWLHTEMLKTRLPHGFCSRDPVAGPCSYANICEQCDNFTPDPDRTDIIAAQLADVQELRADAETRGWTDEGARHARLADTLQTHLTHAANDRRRATSP